MQAVKEKLHDMSVMRKVKAEAKAEEKAEKELAKARMDVAHEVRLAKEAEAEMEMHVAKASERAKKEIAKQAESQGETNTIQDNNDTTSTANAEAAAPATHYPTARHNNFL